MIRRIPSALLNSSSVHVWCFLTQFKRATLCAVVGNRLLRGILLQMFIACSSFRNVCPNTCWDGPSVNGFRNSCRVCSRFSPTTSDTFFWFLWISIFYQTQFWYSALWLRALDHPMQTYWTVIFDRGTIGATLLTVWSLSSPNIIEHFPHSDTFSVFISVSGQILKNLNLKNFLN